MSNELAPPSLGWMAGFFDGEGCIQITRQKPRGERVSPAYGLRVSVTNTDPEAILPFKTRFGGGIIRTKTPSGNYWLWRWTATSQIAARFLREIKSKLRVKKAEADFGLRFQEYVNQTKRRYVWSPEGTCLGTLPLASDDLSQRESFLHEIKKIRVSGRDAVNGEVL